MRSPIRIGRPLILEVLEDRLVLSQASSWVAHPADSASQSASWNVNWNASPKTTPAYPPGTVDKENSGEYANSRPQSYSLPGSVPNGQLSRSDAAAQLYDGFVAQFAEARLEAQRQSQAFEVFQDRQLAANLAAGAADRALAAAEAALAAALARTATPPTIPLGRHAEVAGPAWLLPMPVIPLAQGVAEAQEEEHAELSAPAVFTPTALASTGLLAAGQLPINWAPLEASAGRFLAHLEDLGRDLAGSWLVSYLPLWLAILATPPLILEVVRDRHSPARPTLPGPPRSDPHGLPQ
jgi:hypothetical protein